MRHFSTTLLYHPRNRVVDPSTEVLLRVTDLAPGPQSGSSNYLLARPFHSSAGPSYQATASSSPPRGKRGTSRHTVRRPSPALVQFLVEAGAAAAAAARHRPTVPRPHLLLSWQGFIAIATSVADPPLPACPRIDPHAHVHDPSSSDVSKAAIGTLAREGVRPAPGCKVSPPQALGPPRVLKRSSKSPKIARASRPAGRYSWPPERRAPPARSAAAVGLKYGHYGI